MQSRVLRRLTVAAVLILGAGVSLVSTAEARPSRPSPRVTRGGFNLFAGATNVLVNVNRVQCNITNFGNQCVDPNGSPVVGGGFWPKGSPDQYIFNGGLQVGAVVQGWPDTTSRFSWTGDTVGTFFMDPRGDQRQGDAVTNIYNSLSNDDVANWPSDAYIQDTSLFAAALIGRPTISQQDTWVRYWDGNTNLTTGRKHTMGVLVDQRGLAWNFPSGNEDITYFLFRFINITAKSTSGVYNQLASAGYTAAQIQTIGAIADDFRNRAQTTYNITIPDSGYSFHRMFVNYFQDADEGQAGFNSQTAILPFAEVNVMKADFTEPTWAFPPNIYAFPFAAAPGFEGVKYLKSPINPATGKQFGITVWGNTSNGAPFNDAVGTSQMYRYISATNSPAYGDPSCTVNPQIYHTCAAIQQPVDSRGFMSSGPFDLKPGQSSVIVAAMVYAAPVGSLPATGSGIYALPAWTLPNHASGIQTFAPGIPATAESLAVYGSSLIRNIERAAGWQAFSDANADGIIEQSEVQTVPRSLLDKDKVAQAVFDNKFLLPFAPEGPLFFVVPGDGKVTIAWQKSATETIGDPYFNVASAPLNPDLTANALYDPDYRKFDVEGYRIWRGRTQAEMVVIAQFDYTGTTFTDYTGQVFDSNHPNCAPELGLGTAATCAKVFTYPYVGAGNSIAYDLSSPFIQIPPGGRVQLANGNIYVIQADTAVTGGSTGFPRLTNSDVPFAFIDTDVQNGFQYYYAVTAFDVNSVKSGPTSLESPLVAKSATPRASASNAQAAVIVTGLFGDDNVLLNPLSPQPTIDANSGAISGIVPPANTLSFGFLASVAEALPPGDITAQIDSLTPGTVGGFGGPYAQMYVTLSSGKDTARRTIDFSAGAGYSQVDASSTTKWVPFSTSAPLVRYDSARAVALGITDSAFLKNATMPVQLSGFIAPMGGITDGNFTMSSQRYPWSGQSAAAKHSAYLRHPVWYDESAGVEPPQPTVSPFPSPDHSNGKLTGVTMIYEPLTYRLPNTGVPPGINLLHRYVQYGTSVAHPGDFVVTWGAGGSITVRDSTHHVNLPFAPDMRVSWGFLNERALTAAGVADADIADGTGSPTVGVVGYWHEYAIVPVCSLTFGTTCAVLQNTAELQPINYDNTGAANGNGISLYIDGMYFIMQMSALPAAGTKWHLKAVAATVDATCSTYAPATPAAVPAACSGYSFTPWAYSQGYVPGLSVKMRVTQAFGIAKASGDLSQVHTVPDPYYVTNSLEITANTKILRFVNLPAKAIIRIYSASGILVNVLAHNDPSGGGEQVWNLRNRNNQFVASGVYFYHVEASDGRTKIGRFTVVNFAQ